LLKSLAKLAACYEHNVGLVRDRANFAAGDMDNIPTSGLFCLALAAASKEGMVSDATARGVLTAIHTLVHDRQKVPRYNGLLPHFARWEPALGRYVAFDPGQADRPGLASEYSTVDTALYYHAMLLAADILREKDIQRELLGDISEIQFTPLVVYKVLTDSLGRPQTLHFVRGGYDHTGVPLAQLWDSWGGEGALVLALARMAGYTGPLDIDYAAQASGAPASADSPYEGIGFIAEIQSLFYPQFDSDQPDALTGANWLSARRAVLADQVACTQRFGPTLAAKLGLYGYSAGEGSDGRGYLANGTRRVKDKNTGLYTTEPIFYPHYIFMSACTAADPNQPLHALENLENYGLFPPLGGLVENCDLDLKRPLALLGSLNAAFDALGAYHFLCREENRPDAIYAAAHASATLCAAIRDFYPPR
jgi:hypothetical protein